MAKTKDGVRVEIYDQEYHMRGEVDPEYIQKLAKYLDWKMRTVAAQSHTVDSLRVAVLAALNIADEYHQLKSKYEATTKQIDRKVGECAEVVERLLKLAV